MRRKVTTSRDFLCIGITPVKINFTFVIILKVLLNLYKGKSERMRVRSMFTLSNNKDQRINSLSRSLLLNVIEP